MSNQDHEQEMPKPGKPQAPDWIFENIAEASKLAKRVRLVFVTCALYVLLTALTITDRMILFNESLQLPILNVTVSLTGFLVAAPLLCTFLFVYYQLYWRRIKGLQGQLAEDYAEVPPRRCYPWMVNIASDPEPGFIGWLQRFVLDLSGPLLLVITLSLLAASALRTGSPVLITYLTLFPVVILIGAIIQLVRPATGWLFVYGRQSVVISLAAFVILIGIFFGHMAWPSGPIPRFLRAYLDLSYQTLSSEPAQCFQGAYWKYLRNAWLPVVRLEYADLRHTDFTGAFIPRAKATNACFTGCNFSHAWLYRSALDNALLDSTVLDSTFLSLSDLSHAKIRNANINSAHLTRAVLTGAELSHSTCQNSSLWGAKLDGTILNNIVIDSTLLDSCDLSQARICDAFVKFSFMRGATLTGADLSGTQFVEVNLVGARLDSVTLDDESRFYWCDMSYADLTGSDLEKAHFTRSILDSAILKDVNLTGAQGLTADQLSKARTLYNATIDPALKAELTVTHPHLFEPFPDSATVSQSL